MNENWDEIWNSLSDGMQNNPARKIRQDAILRRLTGEPILDFGAGDGDLVLRIKKMGLNVVGLERSQKGIDRANVRANELGYGDVLFQLDDFVLSDSTRYRSIIVSEVIEHLDEPKSLLNSICKLLAPEGSVIITVPAGPVSQFDRYIGHYRHYSKESLLKEIESGGLDVVSIHQVGFPIVNLVRIWCLIRGDKMIKDLTKQNKKLESKFAKMIIKFITLTSQIDTKYGWQLVAVAKLKL